MDDTTDVHLSGSSMRRDTSDVHLYHDETIARLAREVAVLQAERDILADRVITANNYGVFLAGSPRQEISSIGDRLIRLMAERVVLAEHAEGQ